MPQWSPTRDVTSPSLLGEIWFQGAPDSFVKSFQYFFALIASGIYSKEKQIWCLGALTDYLCAEMCLESHLELEESADFVCWALIAFLILVPIEKDISLFFTRV